MKGKPWFLAKQVPAFLLSFDTMSERGQGGGKHSCNMESAMFTTCFLEVYHNTHLHSYEAWATSGSHYSLWCSSWVLGYDPMHILQQEILLSDNSTPTIEHKKLQFKINFGRENGGNHLSMDWAFLLIQVLIYKLWMYLFLLELMLKNCCLIECQLLESSVISSTHQIISIPHIP